MKHDCAEEFDIFEVYQKLTDKSTPKVRAFDFFHNGNELKQLQQKLNALSKIRRAAMFRSAK